MTTTAETPPSENVTARAKGVLINGEWVPGAGGLLSSDCPATGNSLWTGTVASRSQVEMAIEAAAGAFEGWADTPLDDRIAILQTYKDILTKNRDSLAKAISQETGKPHWEGMAEAGAMIGKIDISITAYYDRTGAKASDTPFGQAALRHKPHGVMAVLGPYNFPGHLPNGHIVPAILAGNTVVFKPSELTPMVGEMLVDCLHQAGLPDGVVNLVQGARDVGEALTNGPIQGLLFTGSAQTGMVFRKQFADRPEVILALELGGNNPLVAWDGDPAAVASIILSSAFITSGQRCTCARRLIMPDTDWARDVLAALRVLLDQIIVDRWDALPAPFMGPLISADAANVAMDAYRTRVDMGVKVVKDAMQNNAFITPGILDVTDVKIPDEEIFAPILHVQHVPDFKTAIQAANATRFGLSAGLISNDQSLWDQFTKRIHAGIVNWNRATTGAASSMPFGGTGDSGNHRASAYYAADYCAYPMASQEAPEVKDITPELKGLSSQ